MNNKKNLNAKLVSLTLFAIIMLSFTAIVSAQPITIGEFEKAMQENAESLDWVVLNNKLGGAWENFKLFGFDIDDSTLAKKTIAVVTGLIMLLHLNNSLIF